MKRNGKKSRKIRKLIITCTLSAVVLIVSTYTWFIGTQTVYVDPFDIEIATTEGLFLSMDGENWVYNLDVMEAAKTAYDNNTNTFATTGLLPISSVGDLDSTVSRMKLFEKGSLTTSPGGFRLLASRVDNYSDVKDEDDEVIGISQGNGYVAFDLFIKNLSGQAYYTANEPLNEEAIYLTFDSSVNVKNSGASDDQLKTGIENSVRVAFAQIGRVSATTTSVDTITGLTCNIDTTEGSETYGKPIYTSSDGVTGICRNAQIWEPNDTKHVNNALNWYNKACITRKSDGTKNYEAASYNVATYNSNGVKTADATYCYADSGATKTYMAAKNNALPTYAISRVLTIDDNVDVYDGAEFNTYEGNTTSYATYSAATDKSIYKLVSYPYFTDTMKGKETDDHTNRPKFMTLAPNSITKVRVYIWLEGQDIDNYDFAQLGKTISVNFGFTKERYTASDIPGYNGPDLVTSDNADIPVVNTEEKNS